MNEQQQTRIIARLDGKGKILDFQDALTLAFAKDYAQLQGIGGKDHNISSGIRCCLTDYSNGTGEKSVYVSALVPTAVIEQILEVCKKNTGTPVISTEARMILNDVYGTLDKLDIITDSLAALTQGVVSACADIIKGKEQPYAAFGKAALSARDVATQTPVEENLQLAKALFTDYTYHQDRVNVYKKREDGKVFVSTVDITCANIRPDGATGKLPWNFKITNFWATPNPQQNGTIAYDSKTISDRSEAFINVSNADMFAQTSRIEHFVRVWEMAVAMPQVAAVIDEINSSYQRGD